MRRQKGWLAAAASLCFCPPGACHVLTAATCLPLPPAVCSLEEDEERERGITPVYVKYDARLYGPRKPGQKVRRRLLRTGDQEVSPRWRKGC